MAKYPLLPTGNESIVELSAEEIAGSDSLAFSSACWRNYIATWEIINNKLYLIGIEGKYRLNEALVFAEWMTGSISVCQGKRMRDVRIGTGPAYERELLFTIVRGDVIRTETIKHKKNIIQRLLGR